MTDLNEDHKHQFNVRIEKFRKDLNMKSKRSFYQYAKIDSAQFFRVINGFQKPGFGFFEKLAIAFPNLNLSWFLTGEGEMNLDRLDSTEKTILENYRKLPDEGKIGFEVRTNLYEREYLEDKELMGNIVDVAMNNENKLPFMSWELYNRLQVLQNLRVNKIISIQKKSFEMAMLSSSDLKSQLENTEADIQKLISLDAEYMKEFLTQTNEE
jgi:hypothetical protein|tara:strand:+ start:110 stop:742 length:633 start_codon:yes stop_codon:yes gene_type:complete